MQIETGTSPTLRPPRRLTPAVSPTPRSVATPEEETTQPWRASTWQWMALNVAFWTTIALLYTTQWALRGRVYEATALWHLAASNLISFAPCALLAPLIAAVTARHPMLRGQHRRTLLIHAAGLVAFIVVAGALMGALEWLLPWHVPANGLFAAAASGIYFYVAPDTLFYVIVVAFVSALTHARESNARSVDQARLRARLAEAQLNMLSMQLQPHFLFNTLNAISALAREEPRQAERLVARLSELLRYSLENTSGITTLAEEFGIVMKYIEIQRARYGARLSVHCDLEPSVRDTPVPPLLLQPLVENAIRHGIAQCPAGGTVTITATRDDQLVRIRVEDDGLGLPVGRFAREGIGIASTRARLDQLYGDAYAFSLTSRQRGGATCEITLNPARWEASKRDRSSAAPGIERGAGAA